ncbi:MAG: copper amine oxidase N-terminal domain-containing protein [Clostridia bacterium]|nr:copper amine oxidase N-terminal domain-containing protein [Clostridia bacterium]
MGKEPDAFGWGRRAGHLLLALVFVVSLAAGAAAGTAGVARAADATGYQLSTLYVWPGDGPFDKLFSHGGVIYVVSSVHGQVSVAQVDAVGNVRVVATTPIPGAGQAPVFVQDAVLTWDASGQMWLALEVAPATSSGTGEEDTVYAGRVGGGLTAVSPGGLDPTTPFWLNGSQLYLQVMVPTGVPHSFTPTVFTPGAEGWQKSSIPAVSPGLAGTFAAEARLGGALYALAIRTPDGADVTGPLQASDVVEAVRVDAGGVVTDLGSPGTYGDGQWALALAAGRLVALRYSSQQAQATLFQQAGGGWSQASFDLSSVDSRTSVQSWWVQSFVGTEDGRLAAAVQTIDTSGRGNFYVALLAPGAGTATAPKVVQVDAQQLLGGAAGGGAPGGGGGAASFQHQVRLVIGQTTVVRDGQVLTLEAAPFIRGGRTVLPIRFVSETMGFEVGWDPQTRTVSIRGNGREIALTVGSTTAKVNGRAVQLDVAPVIVAGRTFVPVRFITENLGGQVGWDPQTRTVTLAW